MKRMKRLKSKTLCVVTGSRAEYGLLSPIIHNIIEDKDCKLCLIVTGMHLDTRCGLTYQEIEQDGVEIDEKVEMNLASDTSTGICKSIGLGIIGLAEAYERQKPDIIILLGDRYELLAAASAALICKIPIAHIHGGEITKGALDDSIRHAITKMSYLHFTSTSEYQRRVIQLGEEPSRVFNVGALGIEVMKQTKFLSVSELEDKLQLSFVSSFFVVTYHPVTRNQQNDEKELTQLLEALDTFEQYILIFTKSNADTGGDYINKRIGQYVKKKKNAFLFDSLGSATYLSLLRLSKAVIGNSSSGILEAPYLKVASVNIGDRQEGRIKPASVIDVKPIKEAIIQGIKEALNLDMDKHLIQNPYERDGTGKVILHQIKQALHTKIEEKKEFYDLELR